FGLLAPLAGGLVAPALRGGHPQIRDRTAVLCAADFRIRTEIADEDHLVDATCHDGHRVTTCGRTTCLNQDCTDEPHTGVNGTDFLDCLEAGPAKIETMGEGISIFVDGRMIRDRARFGGLLRSHCEVALI